MFDRLRDAFREAVENFRAELERDDPSTGEVDSHLRGMAKELSAARSLLDRREGELRAIRPRLEEEREEVARCRRRAEMARRIGDEETARVALEWEARHRRRLDVLELRNDALRKEIELLRDEVTEMETTLGEMRASAGPLPDPTHPRSPRFERNRSLFDELDRRRSALDERQAQRESEAAAGDDPGSGFDRAPSGPVDVDARLAELKRRMERG